MSDEEKHAGGRPRLYDDPQIFSDTTDDYFNAVETAGKLPTLSGLCLHLGFVDKQSFSRYEEYGEEFSLTVKKARLKIEDDRHQRLANPACTGVIFDLKVNHGWQDKVVTELTGADGGPVKTEAVVDWSGVPSDAIQAVLDAVQKDAK